MFKAWFTDDNRSYATNGLDFETEEEAVSYAKGLFSRWFGARDWAVLPKREDLTGFLTPAQIAENCVARH